MRPQLVKTILVAITVGLIPITAIGQTTLDYKYALKIWQEGNIKEAYKILKPRAENGDQDSIYLLANMLLNKKFQSEGLSGRPEAQDAWAALRWWKIASDDGHLGSMERWNKARLILKSANLVQMNNEIQEWRLNLKARTGRNKTRRSEGVDPSPTEIRKILELLKEYEDGGRITKEQAAKKRRELLNRL